MVLGFDYVVVMQGFGVAMHEHTTLARLEAFAAKDESNDSWGDNVLEVVVREVLW